MITQQMLDYIRTQQEGGKSMDEIRTQLLAAGWQEADVTEGLHAFKSGQTAAPQAPGSGIPKASQLLSEAWKIYTSQLGKFLGISAIPSLGAFAIGLGLGLMGVLNESGNYNPNANLSPAAIIGIILAVIALIYFFVWATAALFIAARDRAQNIGFQEAFKRAKPFISPFFTTGLLVGLATAAGFLLLIVPGIIFALWWSQSSYVVLSENLQNTAAMKQSKSYVQGRMGMVFGKMFYIVIITWIIAFIGGFLLSTLGDKTLADLGNSIINIFWTPVVAIYGYLLYEHLKKNPVR